ncbi:MAG: hypothetical protein HOP29_10990, partial [Phycisphaerales bacterium]|nr:hypothetical protein [Phycisphaerales bacterium]
VVPRAVRPRIKPATPGQTAGEGGSPTVVSSDDVTVTSSPGGGAVIVAGYEDAVAEVVNWINELDREATPEKVFKTYAIKRADMDKLADVIMAFCDTPTPKMMPKMMPKGEDDEPDFFDEEPEPTRVGTDIILTVDYANGVLVARATPSKMVEIDYVVKLYEGDEEAEPVLDTSVKTAEVPLFIYELQNADSFDASVELDNLLDVLWPFGGDQPDVDYISGTDKLVVKCKTEHQPWVKQQITDYVDKESTKPHKMKRQFVSVKDALPSDVAQLLADRLPELSIEIRRVGGEIPDRVPLGPYRPEVQKWVMPRSLMRAMEGAASAAMGQQETSGEKGEKGGTEVAGEQEQAKASQAQEKKADENDPEAAKKALISDFKNALGGEPGATTGAETVGSAPVPGGEASEPPIRVYFDDRAGGVVLEGDPESVEEVEEILKDILDEVESVSSKLDVRVYPVKYRDVNVVAEIVETMFGAVRAPQARGGNAAQQVARMQQQMLKMQQLRGQQQQPGVVPPPAIDPKTGQPVTGEEGQEEAASRELGDIRILPDPQTRTIIVRAATEDFPLIVELLATIDRPADVTSNHRIFKLTRLKAADVEEQLKVLLGITRPDAMPRARTPRQAGRGRQAGQNQAAQEIEDALLNFDLLGATGGGAINAASDIVITSNAQANTLLVMAPQAALELVSQLIDELEKQEVPILEMRTYAIKYADATEIATQIKNVFGTKAGGARTGEEEFDPMDVNEVVVEADGRTNKLFVRALDADFSKIEPLIHDLDQDLGEKRMVESFVVANADAVQVASSLTNAYSAAAGKANGKAVKFVGDASSNTVLVTAPDNLMGEIAERIAEIDRLAAGLVQTRVIAVAAGSAEGIGKKLQEVFRAGGRKNDGIQVVGDDASKQLFVTAPDDVFAEIETYAKAMDKASTNIAVRTFTLKHARAMDVHESLMNMVRQAFTQMKDKSSIDVFTASADERTNSIVVLGTAPGFALVESALMQVDVAPTEQAQIVTGIYYLVNADAAEMARNIVSVYSNAKNREKGGVPPTAEANVSGNALIVRGMKSDVEAIKRDFIDPVEENAATHARVREIITLVSGEAADVARLINEELNKSKAGQKGGQPVSVIANESLNSLIVSGPGPEVERIKQLAAEMDKEPTVSVERVTEVIAIKYGDGGSLAGSLTNMYRKKVGMRPEDEVDVAYDAGTSKLIVTANPENMAQIKRVVTDIDVESTSIRTERVLPLRYANGPELARNLQTMFQQTVRRKSGEQTMNIFGDPGTNALIVYANQDEFDRVKSIVEQIDVPSDELEARTTRSFRLSHTNPWTIAEAIKQIYRPQGRQINPRDEVIAVAEPTTMSLIIAAAPEKMAALEQLIAEFDKPGSADDEVKVVEVKNADAGAVTQALQSIYVNTGGQNVRGQATVQISNPNGSDMIVVKAGAEIQQKVLDTIEALDTSTAETGEIEVFALHFTDPEAMKETLENYLRKPGQGVR